MKLVRYIFAVTILLAVSSTAPESFAQDHSDDTQLAEGLRARRLFDLAEIYCRDKLSNPEIDAITRSTLVLELMRTQAGRAALSTGPERETNWAESNQTATDFFSQHPNHPRTLLIEVQQALNFLAHGRLIRQEIQAEIATPAARKTALEQLQMADSKLKQISRKIQRLIPEQRAKTLTAEELSVEQLVSLKNNVHYQTAICNLNRAQLFEQNDNVNRIDALNVVLNQLESVRRETATDQPLWWQIQIARIESLRLLDKYNDANQLLNQLPIDNASNAQQQLALEQKIDLAIASRQLAGGTRLIQQAEKLKDRSPTLDVALVRLTMALANAEPANKDRWLTQASQLTKIVEQQHGRYWGRRAELLLIGSATGATNMTGNAAGNTELDITVRVAEQALRNNNLNDALKAFNKAIQIAVQQNNSGQKFVLSVRAARVLEQLSRHREAATTLESAAISFKTHAASANTHLRGCWNWYRTKTENNTPEHKAAFYDHYRKMLTQNIEFWPQAETANQAKFWLGAAHQAEKEWQMAINAFLSISADSPFLKDAADQVTVSIMQLTRDANSQSEVASSAKNALLKLTDLYDEMNGTNSPALHRVAINMAHLAALFSTDVNSIDAAKKRLSAAFAINNHLESEQAMWLIALQAKFDSIQLEQVQPLIELVAQDAGLAKKCANIINRISAEVPSAQQKKIAPVLGLLVDTTITKHPVEKDIFWMSQKANVLMAEGNVGDAIVLLEQLAKQKPKSAVAQMEFARALTRVEDDDRYQKAITQWRRVAEKLKPRSENWYEAKYNIALLMHEADNSEGAYKLLEYLKATSPRTWKTTSWSKQLNELLVKCQN